nr:3530_t:CDS:2 [Entrophospora candida]
MEPKLNITLHCSITGLDCYRLQNENQRITVAKLTLSDISDNDSKSVNVTSETHPCGLMNNDQDAISSDTSIDDSSISNDAFDSNKIAEIAALKWQHSSVRPGSIIGPAESLDIP